MGMSPSGMALPVTMGSSLVRLARISAPGEIPVHVNAIKHIDEIG